MLRALTGNLDVKGGDVFVGFSPAVRADSEIEMHHLISEEQKAKQLGSDEHPAFTYRGMAALNEPTERVWGARYANLVSGCYMANPMAVFKAMADGVPYPVKAFFALANNALMAYANTRRVYDALMNQDLIVAFEHAMSPTAQISDYVLPGDAWLERPSMQAGISEQAMEPPGECRNIVTLLARAREAHGARGCFPVADAGGAHQLPPGAGRHDLGGRGRVRPGAQPASRPGPGPRGAAVPQGRFRDAVGQGGALLRGARGSRLRPVALLPRGGGALRALPAPDVRRPAGRRVLPHRTPPRPRASPAGRGPDPAREPGGGEPAGHRGRRLGPARDLDRGHRGPGVRPLFHARGPGAGAAWLVEAGIAAGG